MSGSILVFDSGIGGLSILAELRKILPQQNYCYLFDNARLPYGELDETDLVDGCVRLIVEHAHHTQTSIVVVACNSASTLILPKLRTLLTIPVVGVVPAIKPAAQITNIGHIGLLATPGTVKRSYTHELIKEFANNIRVDLFGSSVLVGLAEDKMAGTNIDSVMLNKVLEPIKKSGLDTLVLGCTHFPILHDEIQKVLGTRVTLLDSGRAIAERVKSLLVNKEELPFQQVDKEDHFGSLKAYFTKEEIAVGLYKKLADEGFTTITSLKSSATT